MAHKVKCLYCGKEFDRDTVKCAQIGRRYAHQKCYNECYSDEDFYKEEIFKVVKQIFGPQYNYTTIERQRNQFLKKGLTNKQIFQALNYYYIIKGKPLEGSQGRIGIVPYVVDESDEYYRRQEQKEKSLESIKEPKIIELKVDSIANKTTLKRGFINLEELE